MFWTIWKERNWNSFDNVEHSYHGCWRREADLLHVWNSMGAEFFNRSAWIFHWKEVEERMESYFFVFVLDHLEGEKLKGLLTVWNIHIKSIKPLSYVISLEFKRGLSVYGRLCWLVRLQAKGWSGFLSLLLFFAILCPYICPVYSGLPFWKALLIYFFIFPLIIMFGYPIKHEDKYIYIYIYIDVYDAFPKRHLIDCHLLIW